MPPIIPRGQVIQLSMTYGEKKNQTTLDFDTNMTENVLSVPREVRGAAGYLRFFPGVKKTADVDGVSRGSDWNTVRDKPYRVFGGKVYFDSIPIGDVFNNPANPSRVSMAHSRTSQGVASSDGILKLFRYDGEVKIFTNWPATEDNPATEYAWGGVSSLCHARQRYIFTSGTEEFWISDLTDESHPDYNAPYYRAESMPDGIVAVKAFRDFVLCFGTSTVEFFTLTGNDGTTGPIYQVQPAYMANFGIIGKDAVCNYGESFAFITSPATGSVTVGAMNATGGSWVDIASLQVKKILEGYDPANLKQAVCESVKFKGYNLLIVHLPNETLVYDATISKALGFNQWVIIKTGINSPGPHRAIDYINEGNKVSCGDRFNFVSGVLDDTTSDQYGEEQEIVVYSQPVDIENAIVSDLEVNSNSGGSAKATRLFISASEDNLNWGMDRLIDFDGKQDWVKRVLMRKVGRVRTTLAFKLRIVGSSPVTISSLRVRVS